MLREHIARSDDARALHRQIFDTEADLTSDMTSNTLTVRLRQLAIRPSKNSSPNSTPPKPSSRVQSSPSSSNSAQPDFPRIRSCGITFTRGARHYGIEPYPVGFHLLQLHLERLSVARSNSRSELTGFAGPPGRPHPSHRQTSRACRRLQPDPRSQALESPTLDPCGERSRVDRLASQRTTLIPLDSK